MTNNNFYPLLFLYLIEFPIVFVVQKTYQIENVPYFLQPHPEYSQNFYNPASKNQQMNSSSRHSYELVTEK